MDDNNNSQQAPYDLFLNRVKSTSKPESKPKPKVIPLPVETVDAINTVAESPQQAKTTGWAQTDIDTITIGSAAILIEATKYLSNRLIDSPELSMSKAESDAIAGAVSRIILRHIKVGKGKRGDVTDVAAIVLAIMAYSIRLSDGYQRHKKRLKDAQDANNRSDNIPINVQG